MWILALLLGTSVLADDITATQLDGLKVSGQLTSLSETMAVVETADGTKRVAIENLVDLRWKEPAAAELPAGQLYLLDGSVLTFAELRTASRSVDLTSPIYGKLQLPLSAVRAIRFSEEGEAAAAWAALLKRVRSKDVLVLPKKKKPGELDPTTGVVGQIGESNLNFVLGGDEIPIKRRRVFGVIFARKPVQPKGGFVVEAGTNDRIVADKIGWVAGEGLQLSVGDTQVRIATPYLKRIDCSGGKIRYLDEMQPVFHEFSSVLPDPLYEQIFRYRVNQTMDGEPLRLGGKTYGRGLWIHSKTTLRYDLGGDFSRFETIAGIDDDLPRRDKTKARLTIRADAKTLFDKDIWITDKPRPLKLDVTGSQTLEIVVDFGEKRKDGTPPLHGALQDWVDLVDARVVK
jgi:hypothetical protein